MYSVSPAELHEFLKSKGVKHLYYATTVKNACSMIKRGTLMSNHQLNFQKLPMTPSINAKFEQFVNMWNKIPLYVCDLHGYYPRQNKRGPVCFVMDIDFLLEVNGKDLTVTKRNPLYWKQGIRSRHIAYTSVSEFAENFERLIPEKIAHKNIILVRDKKSEINLGKYTSEIILDMPAHRYLLYKKAENALAEALKASEITSVPIKVRKCGESCFCRKNYGASSVDELEKIFLP